MRLFLNQKTFVDTEKGMDISIPLSADNNSVRAWYCEPVKIEPVINGSFIGDVNQGGSVNFRNIFLNPHGNGTHTECVGHISKENITLNSCLKEFHFFAIVASVTPIEYNNPEYNQVDFVIHSDQLKEALELTKNSSGFKCTALIIRTLKNPLSKTHKNYSDTNPPYLSPDAMKLILNEGIDHLIIDLPSVDREVDHGKLEAHHLFWNYPAKPNLHKTITELVYVPDSVQDGVYFLNIQITSLESDASPSKLVLYELFES